MLSKAYLADGEEMEGGVVTSAEGLKIIPTRGGGATGDMEPGEIHWGSMSLLVLPQRHDFIGFTLEAFIRFEDKSTRWVTSDQYARLVPGDYSGSPKANGSDSKKTTDK